MNKKTIIASLNNIANELDNSGLHQEANFLTNVMIKIGHWMDDPVEMMSFDDAKSEVIFYLYKNDRNQALGMFDSVMKRLIPKDQLKLKKWYLQDSWQYLPEDTKVHTYTNQVSKLKQNYDNQPQKLKQNYTNRTQNYTNRTQNPTQNQNNVQPQNLSRQQLAQQWINQNSPTVGNDVNRLYEIAKENKLKNTNPIEKTKYNDAMAILQSHPNYQK